MARWLYQVFVLQASIFLSFASFHESKAEEQNYQVVLQEDPACMKKDAVACTRLAVAYESGKGAPQDYKLARYYFRKGCELGNSDACFLQGNMVASGVGGTQNILYAIELFDKACTGRLPAPCYLLGTIFVKIQSDPSGVVKARNYFTKACELDHAKACFDLGGLLYQGIGGPKDMDEALIVLHKACDLGDKEVCSKIAAARERMAEEPPKKPAMSQSQELPKLVAESMELEMQGDYVGAIRVLRQHLESEPRDERAMNTISGLLGFLGRPPEQIVWAKKALEINPNFAYAYINLGNGLAASGRDDEAIKAYVKARELAPEDPEPAYSLGVINEQRGSPEGVQLAIFFYKKSVELDPEFVNGYFNLAAVYANLRRFDEAKRLLTKLLSIDPAADDARDMLKRIEREIAKSGN